MGEQEPERWPLRWHFASGVPMLLIGAQSALWLTATPARQITMFGAVISGLGVLVGLSGVYLLVSLVIVGIYRALWFYDRARLDAEP